MKKLFFPAMMAVALLAGTACSSTTTEGEGTVVNAETTTETTTSPQVAGEGAESVATEQFAYICPMKCEGSASHQPGKCPVCGMDLAENPDYVPADNTLK